MAEAVSLYPTLLDFARRSDPDGKIMSIAELLNESNEVLQDMVFVEGNLPTGHRTTIRTGLPAATWRKLNYGVAQSKSATAQVTDSCGMLEAYAEVDKALADLNGNSAEFRLSEARSFIEAMNQSMAAAIFYGDTDIDPEKFMGLSPRFDTYSATSGTSGNQIIKAGGSDSGGSTSIWLVCWGPNTVHGIFPKGSKAGLSHNDLGEVTLLDAANGRFQGYRDHFKWDIGLSVRDFRYIVRIPDIDVSALTLDAASGADICDLMVQALEKVPNLGLGKPVFYCNRTISSFLRRQMLNKSNVLLGLKEVAGQKVLSFGDVPVRRVDQLLNTEATVA